MRYRESMSGQPQWGNPFGAFKELEREREREREREKVEPGRGRGRERILSRLHTQLRGDAGLDPEILGSSPEPTPSVGCSAD